MFRKTAEDDTIEHPAAAPAPQAEARRSRSILGPTLVFKGELSADEDLVIEGKIEGSIHHHNKNLTIGKNGSVKADINARVITIEGTVEGDLLGDEAVVIKSSGRVTGNATGPRVIIEDGATFKGVVDTGSVRNMRTPADADPSQGLPKYSNQQRAS